MKIRANFVSNSSSSSFIVGFPKRPKTAEEVYKLMFPGNEPTVTYYDYAIDTRKAAEQVFKDIQTQKRSTPIAKIPEVVRGGYFEGYPDLDWGNGPIKDTQWEDHRKAVDKAADEYAKGKVIPKMKGKKIFVFEYSDNDGEFFTTMEHGDIFHHLPSVRISHH